LLYIIVYLFFIIIEHIEESQNDKKLQAIDLSDINILK